MSRNLFLPRCILLIPVFFIFSCHRTDRKMPVTMVDEEAELNTQISSLIEDELKIFEEGKDFSLDSDTLVSGPWLTKFYEKQNFSPAWRNRGVESDNADSLLAIINDAEA
jgi:hypothetical protein